MDRKKVCKGLMESFIRMVNRYNALEKNPVRHGTRHYFYHSEKHMLDIIGDNPDANITELSGLIGVTKGAVSQAVSRLEKKGAVKREKAAGNEKEVRIRLTGKGWEIYRHHEAANDETIAHIEEMLKGHPDDKVDFLIDIFGQLEGYLDDSERRMRLHKGGYR